MRGFCVDYISLGGLDTTQDTIRKFILSLRVSTNDISSV